MRTLTLILAFFLTAPSLVSGQPRIDRIINAEWKFARENPAGAASPGFPDSRWEKISLPHTWNARDGQDGGNDYYRGTGWYRRILKIDPAHRGKSFFLKFDGASAAADVYVNGTPAGTHRGAFGAFCFDISKLVRFDAPNLIAVKVSNARDTSIAPLRGDFTVFGGIYRSVHLLVLDPLSVSPLDYASAGVYVKQSKVSAESAELDITTVLRNGSGHEKEATVRCVISDRDGTTAAMVQSIVPVAPGTGQMVAQRATVRNPRLWDGKRDPYLYRVVAEVLEKGKVKDRVEQPLGVRSFRVDPEQGFFLNGRPYRLYGVNRHQDRENLGWAITLKEHTEDYSLIEEIGATALRLAHYQQAKEIYDLCDRGGMVVWAELALVDEIHPSPLFASTTMQQLEELIKQNFNHPSIFFWSVFNELIPDPDPELYARVVTDLNAAAKELDPTRPTVMASRSRYGADEKINSVTDLLAFNVYRGWYEGKPEDFGMYADRIHARFPQRPFSISEYGAGGSVSQHEVPPQKPATRGAWHPEEWQSTLHEITWNAMAARPYLWGTFVWNMFDFASDGRAEGEMAGRNDKGLVTFDRKTKKDAFFWYKANWNPAPMVHIASKRYDPRPAGKTPVTVYSNCDSVRLIVNGTTLGTRSSPQKSLTWSDVELKRGKNSVEAVGFKNGKRFVDSCLWHTPAESPTRSEPRR